MDGTLLDLYFDSFFWMELVPQTLAQRINPEPDASQVDQAREQVRQLYTQVAGTLNWYCTDYWADTLNLPIMAMKREVDHLIGFRPQAEEFLAWLQHAQKHTLIVTNAHRDNFSLKAEKTGLDRLVDQVVSSHDYQEPKESPAFWQHLSADKHLDLSRSLLIDDSEAVLHTAQEAGVGQLLCIRQPDSRRPPRDNLKFQAIQHFKEIF
mgnify:FL=1